MRLDSTAVMQRRHEGRDSLDDFPTPPWATRALCNFLENKGLIQDDMTCREPAANRGYMARTLEEYFPAVEASDIEDYGVGYAVKDYLSSEVLPPTDWMITNPPFVLAKDFIQKSFESSKNTAVILRIAFLEGKGRWNELFSKRKPSYVLQFVERVPMVKGRYDPTASSATAYAWFVWLDGDGEKTELTWIPPCKDELVRERDYV